VVHNSISEEEEITLSAGTKKGYNKDNEMSFHKIIANIHTHHFQGSRIYSHNKWKIFFFAVVLLVHMRYMPKGSNHTGVSKAMLMPYVNNLTLYQKNVSNLGCLQLVFFSPSELEFELRALCLNLGCLQRNLE
jgi:hypothetical protein